MTALFCDLVASTELGERLDPEVLRRVLDRYHQAMGTAIERHGGIVEKFIGDAIVGVFGVPVVHEDDALRAVRAALEMCDALPDLRHELNIELEIRVGIQTGEAVADVASAVRGGIGGDAFNTAARLQTMAPRNGIIVGDETAQLVRQTVSLESLAPLSVKGKSAPIAAWLVTGLPVHQRSTDGAIVGRGRELALLEAAFEEAKLSRSPVLITFVAPPGVGKSRLGREVVASVSERATVLVAQTPSYGDGITFAPLVELLTEAAGGSLDSATAVVETLRSRLATEPDGTAIVDRLAHVLGVGGSASANAGWAVRRLLEIFARDQPIVAILDDLHWAEPPMLDLVEALVDQTHAPIVVLCLARPELLEIRPTWGGGRPRVITMTLPPLSAHEGRALAHSLLGDDAPDTLVDAVIERSEGNPLFLEQVVARLSDEGLVSVGRWTGGVGENLDVPPTIHALLASRLERLDEPTRALLAIAAVEGRRFSVATVASFVARPEHNVRASLEALEPRGFVEQEDESGQRWRFAHALIRDAAYQRLPKERRAHLHEELADRLTSSAADDEAIARHLQQAIGFRREVLLDEGHTLELAQAAGERFAAAGEKAYDAVDLAGAAMLLERAATYLPETSEERFRILPRLGVALMEVGRTHDAEALLADASHLARRHGAEVDALRADVQYVVAKAVYGSTTDLGIEVHVEALHQLRIQLEQLGDRGALAELWMALDYVEFMRGSAAGMFAAGVRAMDEAAASGQLREANQAASDVLEGALLGPLSFDEIRSFGEQLRLSDDPIRISTGLAAILAADVAQGVDLTSTERSWRSVVEGNGFVWLGAVHGAHIAELELESGAFEAAERRISGARQTVLAMGDVWYLNAMDPILAFAVDGQGRTKEFLRIADQYEARATMFDREARIRRHVLRARALRHRGRLDDAEVAARTGLELAESTDLLPTKAAVLTELSIVLAARGFGREAASYEERAIEVYRQKGNLAALTTLTHDQ